MKNKKTVALAMAAMSVAGTVVPTFASEVESSLPSIEDGKKVNLKLTEGKSIKLVSYEGLYNTNFTQDKNDDTLKENVELLEVIESITENASNKSGKFLVAIDDETLTEKQINDEKAKKDRLEKEIEQKLKITDEDKNNKLRKVYKIEKKEVSYSSDKGTNGLLVTLTPKEGFEGKYSVINYMFEGIVIEGKEVILPSTIKQEEINLNDGTNEYKELSWLAYDLEKAGDKYTVSKMEDNSTTLIVKVYTNDENKTLVRNIKIANVDKFDSKKFKRIPGKNDFNGHWAEKTIFNSMYNGRVDISNKFRPNDGITRAEFVKIINRTFKLDDPAKKEYFADVEKGQWFYDDILVAVKAGYIKGYEDGTFRPNEKISRQEAAVIIARLNNKENVEINGNIETGYKDDKDIAVWADESVKFLKDEGIIKGYEDGTFRPKNDITRAEAITMIKEK